MSIRQTVYLECDVCKRDSPESNDELGAKSVARGRNWRIIHVYVCQGELHICPTCAKEKTDEELMKQVLNVIWKGES